MTGRNRAMKASRNIRRIRAGVVNFIVTGRSFPSMGQKKTGGTILRLRIDSFRSSFPLSRWNVSLPEVKISLPASTAKLFFVVSL